MKWFKHDSDANTDAKLKKVRHKYGIEGYGLYWYCIELIAGSISTKNISFELEEDAEIIALEWRLDQIKVQEIMLYMVDIDLFDISDNNRIRCLKLAKRLDDTNAKNPHIKKIISQIDSELIGESPTNSEKVPPDETRLDKTIKDKKTLVEQDEKTVIYEQSKKCIFYLNEKTGSKFKCVDSNMKFLKARFKEGYNISDIFAVIDSKVNEWTNTKHAKYLRPATLFNAEKFNQYYGQLKTAVLPVNIQDTDYGNDEGDL